MPEVRSTFHRAAAALCAVLLAAAAVLAGCNSQPAPQPQAEKATDATVPPQVNPPNAPPAATVAVDPSPGTQPPPNPPIPLPQSASSPAAQPPRAAESMGTDLPADHYVPPNSAAELARKREQWQEVVSQGERQAAADAWMRSRAEASNNAKPLPRVGSAPQQDLAAVEQARNQLLQWHRGYVYAASALRTALQELDISGNEPVRVQQACIDLRTAVEALAEDRLWLTAPLPEIARPLATAWEEIKATTQTCRGTDQDRATHLAAAHRALSAVDDALVPYGLKP